MNRLDISRRAQILHLLCEGSSLRASSRIADVSINTVTKLLVDTGAACAEYHDKVMRELPCKRVQVDEIWSFCYAKANTVPTAKAAPVGAGDVWTWTAIDADTKLVPCWMIGDRTMDTGKAFMLDLASRLANRIQLTSDGHRAYPEAVELAFGANVDYARLVKIYGHEIAGRGRYSPPMCVGAEQKPVTGNPDPDHISTSYVERQNLNMRMGMRRFTRLTNAFSKKAENHAHAIALFSMHHNFVRVHKTTRTTPALSCGVSDHQWTMEEIAQLSN